MHSCSQAIFYFFNRLFYENWQQQTRTIIIQIRIRACQYAYQVFLVLYVQFLNSNKIVKLQESNRKFYGKLNWTLQILQQQDGPHQSGQLRNDTSFEAVFLSGHTTWKIYKQKLWQKLVKQIGENIDEFVIKLWASKLP